MQFFFHVCVFFCFTCAFQLFHLFCLVHDKLLRVENMFKMYLNKYNVAVAKMTIFFPFVSEKIGSKIKVHISISIVIKSDLDFVIVSLQSEV